MIAPCVRGDRHVRRTQRLAFVAQPGQFRAGARQQVSWPMADEAIVTARVDHLVREVVAHLLVHGAVDEGRRHLEHAAVLEQAVSSSKSSSWLKSRRWADRARALSPSMVQAHG